MKQLFIQLSRWVRNFDGNVHQQICSSKLFHQISFEFTISRIFINLNYVFGSLSLTCKSSGMLGKHQHLFPKNSKTNNTINMNCCLLSKFGWIPVEAKQITLTCFGTSYTLCSGSSKSIPWKNSWNSVTSKEIRNINVERLCIFFYLWSAWSVMIFPTCIFHASMCAVYSVLSFPRKKNVHLIRMKTSPSITSPGLTSLHPSSHPSTLLC